jgi:hypothetical protein
MQYLQISYRILIVLNIYNRQIYSIIHWFIFQNSIANIIEVKFNKNNKNKKILKLKAIAIHW